MSPPLQGKVHEGKDLVLFSDVSSGPKIVPGTKFMLNKCIWWGNKFIQVSGRYRIQTQAWLRSMPMLFITMLYSIVAMKLEKRGWMKETFKSWNW